ncbi:MAG TPA: GlsB/YeaQ/YmgE family stress response membrane protein [Bryobacteraceae bacterium]|nr:GlsB/YeaQ/YmgE family stress response membrane protein [Bryobacteraceae bacterium]
MTLFAWIVLGFIAGFIASHLVNHRGEGMVLDILLGIVGAMVGGWAAPHLGFAGVSRLDVHSVIVATAGSIIFLFAYHAIRRGVMGRRYF